MDETARQLLAVAVVKGIGSSALTPRGVAAIVDALAPVVARLCEQARHDGRAEAEAEFERKFRLEREGNWYSAPPSARVARGETP